jgi:hypothetical protein
MGVSVGTTPSVGDIQQPELERELTRLLFRRGCKLRVKRRRSDTNVTYAEKQLAEIARRLTHVCEHVAGLQLERVEGERLVMLARSLDARHGNQKDRS